MPDDVTRREVHHSGPLNPAELIERSVVLLLFAGLLIGVLAVLRPFATAILFGATLAISAWPLRQALIGWGVRRGFAAAALLLLAIVVIAAPVLALAPVLTDQLARGIQNAQSYFAVAPQPPGWLASVPILGNGLEQAWEDTVHAGGNVGAALAPYAVTVRQMLLSAARALADSVVQMVLSLIVATTFWVNGTTLVEQLRDILRRLGGATAEQTLDAAAGAVRSVAYGVIGTALIQAMVLTLGLALAGVPGAVTLGFVTLLLAVSQIGAPLLVVIWGGAAWWLFGHDSDGWGVFMICWGLFTSTIDNFIKPWLIGRGVQMPLPLTILGVFGGLVAFGFLGLFIGPTLIAVAFILLRAWRTNLPDRRADA